MYNFKKSIFKTSDDEEVVENYCTTWIAENDSNIKMSLDGTVDFTEELAGRSIHTGASTGVIKSYIIDGSIVTTSIPMTFNSTQALFSVDTLVVETDKVLTGITFDINIICTDVSEIDLIDQSKYSVQIPGVQLVATYDDCE